jgi:hypothetical protein
MLSTATLAESRVIRRVPVPQSFRACERSLPFTSVQLWPHALASTAVAAAHHSFSAFPVVRACCAHAVTTTPRKPALELVGGSSLCKFFTIIIAAVTAAG